MINYITTRDKTDFAAYQTSYTYSASNTITGATSWLSYTSNVIISNGISQTQLSENASMIGSHSDLALGGYNQASNFEGASTYYSDATNQSLSQSSSFSISFAGSNSDGSVTSSYTNTASDESSNFLTNYISGTFFTTSNTDYTYPRTTTSNLPASSSFYTVSGSGTNGTLTTYTGFATVVSSTTDEATATSISQISTALGFSTYYEQGGVYSAQNDWLWNITAGGTTPSFVSDLAYSATAFTLWPVPVSIALTYVSATDLSQFGNTLTIPADSTAYTYNTLITTSATSSSTITSGDSISFDTASTPVLVWTTDTVTTVYGPDSTTVSAVSSVSSTATMSRWNTYLATVVYPFGLNTSTIELTQLSSSFDTTTTYNTPIAYLVSATNSGDGGYTEWGQTWGGTDLSYGFTNAFAFGGGAYAINAVAPVNAFVAPSDLRSAGNPYHFVDNLSFGTTRLPYPQFSGVFSNANVPAPMGFTTTGTDGHSFRYSWANDTLLYTEAITQASGTTTITVKTMTSGVFSSSGPMDSYYQDGGSVYGGFPAIPSAAETVYFSPRAVIGTSISTNGASTTYRTLNTLSYSQAFSETAIVEQTTPAFIVVTAAGGEEGGGGGLLIYDRN